MEKALSGNDVCIVGYGCVLPEAENPAKFWNNLLAGKSSIRPLPESRWDKKIYLSADGAEDKISSDFAAYVDDAIIETLSRNLNLDLAVYTRLHVMALESARQALGKISIKALSERKTSVILGCTNHDEHLCLNIFIDEESSLRQHILKSAPELLEAYESYIGKSRKLKKKELPTLLLTSVGRLIQERYNLHGENFIVDAACASSLAAIGEAMKRLQSYSSDIVITGGMDADLAPETFLMFSKAKVHATGNSCFPFDKKTTGMIQGEGAVIFVLKRLEDALRDNDPIHGVLRSCRAASDGKKGSLFSTSPEGQLTALETAHANLGKEIAYIECHGTGTKLGDATELEVLERFFEGYQGKTPIGSVKSLIGHTKGAAGAAGLLKCLLAMRYNLIPPSPYFEESTRAAEKVYVNTSPIAIVNEGLFGISSFGFGGVNYHAVLERYIPGVISNPKKSEKEEIVVIAESSVENGEEINFEDYGFPIPPSALNSIDRLQLQSLIAVKKALESSKIPLYLLDRGSVSVFSASCLGTDMAEKLSRRVRHFELHNIFDSETASVIMQHKEKYPKITENSGPGLLNSVIAGIVCNQFDFRGKSLNIDADLNSLIFAIKSASLELQSRESSIVIIVAAKEQLNMEVPKIERSGVRCLILTTLDYTSKKNFSVLYRIKDNNS